MSKKREKAYEHEWRTKQSRMLADLYKIFFDVLDANNLYGNLDAEITNKHRLPAIEVIIYSHEDGRVKYHESIFMKDTEHYSTWVNRIIEFKNKLEKFGKEY